MLSAPRGHFEGVQFISWTQPFLSRFWQPRFQLIGLPYSKISGGHLGRPSKSKCPRFPTVPEVDQQQFLEPLVFFFPKQASLCSTHLHRTTENPSCEHGQQTSLCDSFALPFSCWCSVGNEGMNPGIPLKDTTSWMVFLGVIPCLLPHISRIQRSQVLADRRERRLCVVPDYRGQKLASELTRRSLSLAKAKGRPSGKREGVTPLECFARNVDWLALKRKYIPGHIPNSRGTLPEPSLEAAPDQPRAYPGRDPIAFSCWGTRRKATICRGPSPILRNTHLTGICLLNSLHILRFAECGPERNHLGLRAIC